MDSNDHERDERGLPRILVFADDGNVLLFDSTTSAERAVESPDVEDETYPDVFDRSGARLTWKVHGSSRGRTFFGLFSTTHPMRADEGLRSR